MKSTVSLALLAALVFTISSLASPAYGEESAPAASEPSQSGASEVSVKDEKIKDTEMKSLLQKVIGGIFRGTKIALRGLLPSWILKIFKADEPKKPVKAQFKTPFGHIRRALYYRAIAKLLNMRGQKEKAKKYNDAADQHRSLAKEMKLEGVKGSLGTIQSKVSERVGQRKDQVGKHLATRKDQAQGLLDKAKEHRQERNEAVSTFVGDKRVDLHQKGAAVADAVHNRVDDKKKAFQEHKAAVSETVGGVRQGLRNTLEKAKNLRGGSNQEGDTAAGNDPNQNAEGGTTTTEAESPTENKATSTTYVGAAVNKLKAGLGRTPKADNGASSDATGPDSTDTEDPSTGKSPTEKQPEEEPEGKEAKSAKTTHPGGLPSDHEDEDQFHDAKEENTQPQNQPQPAQVQAQDQSQGGGWGVWNAYNKATAVAGGVGSMLNAKMRGSG